MVRFSRGPTASSMTDSFNSDPTIFMFLVPQLYQFWPGQCWTFAKQLYRFCCKRDVKRRHQRRRSILVFNILNFGFVLSCEGFTNGGSSNFLLRSVSCLITSSDVADVSPDAAERESWVATNVLRSSSFLKRHSFNLFANSFSFKSRKRWTLSHGDQY